MLKMLPGGGGICLVLVLQFLAPLREVATAGLLDQAESHHHLGEAPPSSFIVHRRNEETSKSSSEGQQRFKRRLKSSKLPEFGAPIGNVTSVLGRDVRLICTVENLGQYQVSGFVCARGRDCARSHIVGAEQPSSFLSQSVSMRCPIQVGAQLDELSPLH